MKIPFTSIEFSFNNKTATASDDQRPKNFIKHQQQLFPSRQDVGGWRRSVTVAKSIRNPNRTELYRLYDDVVIDAHVTAAITNRKNAILGAEFMVTKNGIEDEEKTKLIKTKWFLDFTNHALDSKYWGFSLVQFGDIIENEFSDIELVPRQYVKPEFGIVTASTGQNTGQSYLEPPFSEWSIGVGDKRDLGLLMKVAPLYLWKKGALGAWAEYSDKFGTPMRIGKTDAKDLKTTTNMTNMLRNMGSSAWGMFDLSDEIQLLETAKTDAYQVFDMMIERCNSEISKLILGQTGTTDEKSFVGSAQVHERVADMYRDADETFIENIYSYQLVPFLIGHGFDLEGCKIEVREDNELTLDEKTKVDDMLLKNGFDIPEDYIQETYGTPVTKKAEPIDPNKVKNKLDEYYR